MFVPLPELVFWAKNMIKKLTIRNLQAHKETVLDFAAPGVNVIVGKSSQGKSSIIRSLVKLVHNRPVLGIESWMHGHDPKNQISIQVETTDGHAISWDGPSNQRYVVDGQEYRGFGQSVPEPVSEALQMGDVNIQAQFDLPFLVFDPPGQVARYLNRVASLDSIDKTLSSINSLARANSGQQTATQQRISELKSLTSSFPDLESAEQFIVGLEQISASFYESKARLASLLEINRKILLFRNALSALMIPPGIGDKANSLVDTFALLERVSMTRQMLIDIGQKLTEIRKRLGSMSIMIRHMDAVEHLLSVHHEVNRQRRLLSKTVSNNAAIQKARVSHHSAVQDCRGLEREFNDLWPGSCPLCGSSTGYVRK